MANGALEDVIAGFNALSSSSSPPFANDRFGAAKGAIALNSLATVWTLPAGVYIQAESTLTLWVKKLAFGGTGNGGSYGKQMAL
jgi:hypothetical protein